MNTVIIDYNNISMSRLFSKDVMVKDGYDVTEINYHFWRFKVFSDIYYYLQRFNAEEMIIAVDNSKSWRKIYFPRYKEKRAGFRDKFNIDWNEYNRISSDFIDDMKSHMPFKIIKVDKCEGDDIIGTISLHKKEDNITIISSDSDFLQLCRNGLKVFSIKKQAEISHPNPEMFLQEACLKGQTKDNIMNVITPLDYPAELRRPPFGDKKSEKFLIQGLDKALNQKVEYKRKYIDNEGVPRVYTAEINLRDRYEFNRNLMDFSRIPNTLKKAIISKYNNYTFPDPDKIYQFIKKYNWTFFLEKIANVENSLYELYPSEKRRINV